MTTESGASSRKGLLEVLRSSERDAIEKLGSLPELEFEHGRYENGWNARQILAHVASIEWTYARLIDLAKQGSPLGANERPPEVRWTAPEQSTNAPSASTRPGGIDGYNQRQVEKRANVSIGELIAEFQKNRAATIAAVEHVDETLLRTPIRSAGGITGTLGDVLRAVAVEHVRAHVNDIVGAEHTGRRW